MLKYQTPEWLFNVCPKTGHISGVFYSMKYREFFFWWVSYIKSISGDEYSQEQEEFDPQSTFHLS